MFNLKVSSSLFIWMMPLFCMCNDQCQDWLNANYAAQRQNSAVQITSGDQLRNYLQGTKNAVLIKVFVINGTVWLDRGGDVQDFKLVIGRPPDTSSDMTFREAMENLLGSKSGILVEPDPESLTSKVVEELKDLNTDNNIWISSREEDIDDRFQRSFSFRKNFGMDTIFNRVLKENILLEHDFQRIKSIVATLYSGSDLVEYGQLNYLRRKLRNFERNNRSSFTYLYVLSVLKLSEKIKSLRERNMVDLMPDLQVRDVEYDENDVVEFERAFKTRVNDGSCVLLEVQAGILCSSTKSTEVIGNLLTGHESLIVILSAEPFDYVPPQKLSKALKSLSGYYSQRIIFDLPEKLSADLRNLDEVSVPQTDFQKPPASSSSSSVSAAVFLVVFSIIMLRV